MNYIVCLYTLEQWYSIYPIYPVGEYCQISNYYSDILEPIASLLISHIVAAIIVVVMFVINFCWLQFQNYQASFVSKLYVLSLLYRRHSLYIRYCRSSIMISKYLGDSFETILCTYIQISRYNYLTVAYYNHLSWFVLCQLQRNILLL